MVKKTNSVLHLHVRIKVYTYMYMYIHGWQNKFLSVTSSYIQVMTGARVCMNIQVSALTRTV